MQTLLADTDAHPAVAGNGTAETSGEDVPELASAAASLAAALALRDVAEGARVFRLWGMLGWQDVRQRYRRSTLGPFWLTISMGALVGGAGRAVRRAVQDGRRGLPSVRRRRLDPVGADFRPDHRGCAAFIGAEGIINQVNLPLSVHVYRVVWRNVIVFAHNVVIYVAAAVLFSIRPGWTGLLALPGLALRIGRRNE